MSHSVTGNIVFISDKNIQFGTIHFENEKIIKIEITGKEDPDAPYILPGFIDAHVHIESSMLVPSEFAKMAVIHGTVATVSDPHEIANIMGTDGVHYMIENGKTVPFHFFFGAPSCVPATPFETAGAAIDVAAVEALLKQDDIYYLSEMMNYPGVLHRDAVVMEKIKAATTMGKPVDGHAPGLRGHAARRYYEAGISTDHECFTYEEGLEKLQLGMKILIREGSAAKNFDALIDLLPLYPRQIMFCSDDKHPDDLITGHINQLAARAISHGCDIFEVLAACCVNPVLHYKLPVGLLRTGDYADFIVAKDLDTFGVKATYIRGQQVSKNGESLIATTPAPIINTFHCRKKKAEDFRIVAKGSEVKVIKALDGEIITKSFTTAIPKTEGWAMPDLKRDILKFAVVNRYEEAEPALAFIHGFRLRTGAIASCVGHDSHNILAVGCDDESLCAVVNAIIQQKGGIAASDGSALKLLPLPIAGIMSNDDGMTVAKQYADIDAFVKTKLGTMLTAPFMTLSFMALLVIPELKLSDMGLFDGKKFEFTRLFKK